MLKVRDCISGEVVSLDSHEPIESGRFALIRDCSLGGHGTWSAGTMLLDDSHGSIDVDGLRFEFTSIKRDSKATAERSVAIQALEEIASLAKLSDVDSLPSPVIPPEIAHRFESTKLEQLLIEVLRQGYLHSIAKSPRISMRYDDELLPVSRVKRTANDYQRHLAAHSECWQKRTFTGIVPKLLKAKISEDEIHIYENRVYARLLDHLERYALEKLAELRALHETLQEGLELEGSDSLHRSLRYALCHTWGESFSHGQAESLKLLSESQMDVFDDALRKIQQLKQSSTYRSIPRQAQVPLALKSTNILTNDPHYRKARELWELWVREIASCSRDPIAIFKERQNQYSNYQHYIGLILLRAHTKTGWKTEYIGDERWSLRHPSGTSGLLSLIAGEWCISYPKGDDTKTLVFVPCVDLSSLKATFLRLKPNRHLCHLDDGISVAGSLYCSPENIFTEEYVIELVQYWWLERVASQYGVDIGPLPRVIRDRWPSTQPVGQFKSLPDSNVDEFLKKLGSLHVSDELKVMIEEGYMAANFVSHCPCCGRKSAESDFALRDGRGFKSACNLCAATWQIRWSGSAWLFEVGADAEDRVQAGRWSKVLDLGANQRQVA